MKNVSPQKYLNFNHFLICYEKIAKITKDILEVNFYSHAVFEPIIQKLIQQLYNKVKEYVALTYVKGSFKNIQKV